MKQLKPVNGRAESKVAKKETVAPKAKTGGRKRGRKPKLVVVESESDESEPGRKTFSPSPKRSRRKAPVSNDDIENRGKPPDILGGTTLPDPLPVAS